MTKKHRLRKAYRRHGREFDFTTLYIGGIRGERTPKNNNRAVRQFNRLVLSLGQELTIDDPNDWEPVPFARDPETDQLNYFV